MPIFVDKVDQGHCLYLQAATPNLPTESVLRIGLVNNMPDGAFASTEQQLFDLLQAAGEGLAIRLSLYALPTITRSKSAQHYVDRFYTSIDTLYCDALDGLIVTGAEPRASQLTEEPYWSDLGKLFDWAKHGACSTMCSCLRSEERV